MITSINSDRVAIHTNEGLTIQLVVWDLQKKDHKKLLQQIDLITSISNNISDWIKHLAINGFDVALEGIY